MQTQVALATTPATPVFEPALPALDASPELLAAALALLDCWAAGILAAAPMAPSFQRFEIDREFRVDMQILHGPGATGCGVVALTCVACFRRGTETGALVVTNAAARPHIAATIASIAAEIDRAEVVAGPFATLWFDPPPKMPAAG